MDIRPNFISKVSEQLIQSMTDDHKRIEELRHLFDIERMILELKNQHHKNDNLIEFE